MNTFDRSDISKRNGSDKWEAPVPGTFVIDTNGVVRFAQVDPNFMTGRANPEAVLDILTTLSPHREGKEIESHSLRIIRPGAAILESKIVR
ncbi:MAG: hypothetical protein ABSG03_13710 [Bryobacteraceae bacterium]